MKRAWIAASAMLAISMVEVWAQTAPVDLQPPPLTEAQKRKMLLPYVRALTNCVAQAITSSPSAMHYARQDKWAEAIKSMNGGCREEAVPLIDAHDRLYGVGTGQVFFNGPYIADLPRALSARLKPELQRQAAEAAAAEALRRNELARQEADRQHAIEVAEKAGNLLRDKLYDCATEQLVALVKSSEAAEVLATAAMTICGQELEQAVQGRMSLIRIKYPETTDAEVPGLRSIAQKSIREQVVARAVQVRAAAASVPSDVRGQPPATIGGGTIPAAKAY